MLEKIETHTHTDADGNTTTSEKATLLKKVDPEPDYIKLYTKMWLDFSGISSAPLQKVFMLLVARMTYTDLGEKEGGQLVQTGYPTSDEIMKTMGWTSRRSYQAALKQLCELNALRRVRRGVYQVNPSYAGKGPWHYDPKAERGGVDKLIAKFQMLKDGSKSVETEITFSNNGTDDSDLANSMREGLGINKNDLTSLITTRSQQGGKEKRR